VASIRCKRVRIQLLGVKDKGKNLANIASVLKDEIARIARKEVRSETEGLKKASAQYRSDIAALKRRVASLEQQVSRLQRTAAKPEAEETPADAVRFRFSAKGLGKQRQRLGLSAADAGTLIGVSAQTIYNWESGATHPRATQKAAVVALRQLGKKDAAIRLERLHSAN
jgi:DNA-binding transcriptional regulator YiaG